LSGNWLGHLLGVIFCLSSFATTDQLTTHRGHRDPCPVHCNIAGPNPSNWSAYGALSSFQLCRQTIFLEFSVYGPIDGPNGTLIHACTVWDGNWKSTPKTPIPATAVNSTYTLGLWNADSNAKNSDKDVKSLVNQMQAYFKHGHGATNRTSVIFGLSGDATIGIYLGKALQNEWFGKVALQDIANAIFTTGNAGPFAAQLCVRYSRLSFLF
jgi:hypothetical protein